MELPVEDFVNDVYNIIEDVVNEVSRKQLQINSLSELMLAYPIGFDFTTRLGLPATIHKLEHSGRIVVGICGVNALMMHSYNFILCESIFDVLLNNSRN